MEEYIGVDGRWWYETPNILLGLMLAAYIVPIAYVYYKYSTATSGAGTRSISSIITSQEPVSAAAAAAGAFQTRHLIAVCMFVMACFTILYEYQRCVARYTWWSLFAILALLIGIFGVIFIPEQNPTHYLFAGTAFLAIIGFMTAHTVGRDIDIDIADNLRILLYAQFLFMVVTVIGVIHDTPIFIFEALFLMNFAVMYLYLHSISFHFISFHFIPFHSIPFHFIRHSPVRGRVHQECLSSADATEYSRLTCNLEYTDTREARQRSPKIQEKPRSSHQTVL
jgi:hypothetical protein